MASYSNYALGNYSYSQDADQRRTATEMKRMEMEYKAKVIAVQRAALAFADRPQTAMDEFLGGVPYEEVLELVSTKYPEKFI